MIDEMSAYIGRKMTPPQAAKPVVARAANRSRRFGLMNRFWSSPITPRLSHAAQAIWCYLWRLADTDGTCYPPESKIAERLGRSERHARRGLKELRDQGFLVVLVKGSNRGRNRANRYRIVVPG